MATSLHASQLYLCLGAGNAREMFVRVSCARVYNLICLMPERRKCPRIVARIFCSWVAWWTIDSRFLVLPERRGLSPSVWRSLCSSTGWPHCFPVERYKFGIYKKLTQSWTHHLCSTSTYNPTSNLYKFNIWLGNYDARFKHITEHCPMYGFNTLLGNIQYEIWTYSWGNHLYKIVTYNWTILYIRLLHIYGT